jgi:DNA-directed RNA polymerase subunit F
MAALAHDLSALLRERQSIDLNHIVEKASEHLHDFAKFGPVKFREFAERVAHKLGEIHRAQETRTVRR